MMISVVEFEGLVARGDWVHEQAYECVGCEARPVVIFDAENELIDLIEVSHVWGWASKTSVLDGIKITYAEGFSYDEYEPESFSSSTVGMDKVWVVEGVSVVGEGGEILSDCELAEYLSLGFSEIDYSELEIEKFADVDVDEGGSMEIFTLRIDNAPGFRFSGELVGSSASSDNRAMGESYSGKVGRWTELALYKTTGGKFVCHQVTRTRWRDERDVFIGKVCESLSEVKDFFGSGWVAKKLYEDSGLDFSVDVE